MNLLLAILLSIHIAGTPNIRLTHQYESDNDSYFDGKLPKNVIVYSDGAEGNMGLTNRCNDRAFCIHINPELNPATPSEELTMFHEECHIEVETSFGPQFDAHGALWQRCMHRLANQGVFDTVW
jgi:hypothetical protein